MARDIDRMLIWINQQDWLSDVHKEVLRARVDYPPTKEEIANAVEVLSKSRKYNRLWEKPTYLSD